MGPDSRAREVVLRVIGIVYLAALVVSLIAYPFIKRWLHGLD